MIELGNTILTNCIVHKVGNKNKDEKFVLSTHELHLTDDLIEQLSTYFLRQFKTINETYHFHHEIDLKMNEVFVSVDNIFENENFIENSSNIVKHLYHQTKHPAIKPGEVFIAQFEEITIDDVICKGVGIFKCEKKDTFFKVVESKKSIEVKLDEGISQQKIDKGCLILNDAYHEGFKVFTYEHNNADTEYWRNDFLSILPTRDKYKQTNDFIQLIKEYSHSHIQEQYGKQEQVNFINQTFGYISKGDQIDTRKFEKEFLINESDRSEFKNFKKNYLQTHDFDLPDTFDVAPSIIKMQKRKFKNEIKLDTQISIKLNGENLEYSQKFIEKGFDSKRKMNYYKVFFNIET